MDFTPPPTPDQINVQLANAGIPIDAPAPPEVGGELSDEALQNIAKGQTDPYAHLSDEQLEHIAGGVDPNKYAHLSDEELRKIAGDDSGALDPKRDKQTTGNKVSDFGGSILAGMNKVRDVPFTDAKMSWNPMLWGPEAGQYIGNKVAQHISPGAAPNTDITDAITKNFVPNPEATTANKMGEAGGNMLMSVPATGAAIAATPGLSALAAARYLPWAGRAADGSYTVQALKNAAIAVPRFGQYMLKGATANPAEIAPQLGQRASAILGKQNIPQSMTGALTKYGTSLVGAGAGQEGMHEATEGSGWQVPAEIAGAVMGGGLPSTPSLAMKYWKYGISPNMLKIPYQVAKGSILNNIPDTAVQGEGGIPSYIRGMKAKYTDELNKKALPEAADMFHQMMTPEAGQNMAEAQRLRGQIPGFNPTMAEATGVPSLMATQKGTEAGASGNLLDQMVRRKQTSETGIQNYAEQQAPAAGTGDVTDAVQRRVDQAAEPLTNQAHSVQSLREGVADTLPTAKPYDTGNYLRDRQETLRQEVSDDMTKQADNLGLNDAKNLRVSAPSIKAAVAKSLPSALASNATPTLRTIMKLDTSEPMAFKDIKYLMESLGQDARSAAAKGDAHTAKIAGDARQGIDDYLQNEWAPALKIGEQYKQFRQMYKSEYIDRFGTGTARDVGRTGPDQNYRTDNEDVAGSYFAPGDVTAAKDFHRTFGGDPQALQAVEAHALDDIRQKAVKDGVVDPAKLGKWMEANKDNLAEFPSLEKKVYDMKSLNEGLADRQATLNSRQAAVEDSRLNQMLQDKKVSVDNLLQDKASFKRVMQGATPEEKASMARQMWDRAGQGGAEDPAAMKKFLSDHADVLPTVLGKEHIDALHDIQKAWEMNARAPTPVGQPLNPNAIHQSIKSLTGSSPQQLLSRAFAVESGRTGIKYTMGDLIARAGLNLNSRQAQQMMDRAMYDPKFAEQLASHVNSPKITMNKVKTMRSYLLNAGIYAEEDKHNDEVPHIDITRGAGWDADPAHNQGIMGNFQGGQE